MRIERHKNRKWTNFAKEEEESDDRRLDATAHQSGGGVVVPNKRLTICPINGCVQGAVRLSQVGLG